MIIRVDYLFPQNETHWITDKPGKWSYVHNKSDDDERYKLTVNEYNQYRKKMNFVVETFHQNPVLKDPVGFESTVNSRIWIDDYMGFTMPLLANEIVRSRIAIQFCPYFKNKSGSIEKHCMEVSVCEVVLNSPKFTADSYLNYSGDGYNEELTIAAQRLNKIFIKPAVVKEMAEGVTAYSSGIIVVANPQRLYWILVTAGEMFDLILNYWELKSQNDNDAFVVIDYIKKEKAAYSPDELTLPAYSSNESISKITTQKNNGQYMRFNPDYFDQSLPRTYIQLITLNTLIEAYSDNCRFKNVDYLRHYEFVKSLDGEMLKGLLDTK